MNDREMLELAAKAAGRVLGAWHDSAGAFLYRDAYPGQTWWNPLTSDGDALRLLAVLVRDYGYELENHNDAACLQSDQYDYVIEVPWDHDSDLALREAVVRAAAEIGRNMA